MRLDSFEVRNLMRLRFADKIAPQNLVFSLQAILVNVMPSLPPFDPAESSQQFKTALTSFTERLAEDRNILAAVLVGSIDEPHVWRKNCIGLWIIEADERIFRTFVILPGKVTAFFAIFSFSIAEFSALRISLVICYSQPIMKIKEPAINNISRNQQERTWISRNALERSLTRRLK